MIVLDTQIKPTWRTMIEERAEIGVSAISCFEVAWLTHHGRIQLSCTLANWFKNALTGSGINLLPITPDIVEQCVTLPEHHSDPQDRLIIATAIVHGAQLISADTKFPLYRELEGALIN